MSENTTNTTNNAVVTAEKKALVYAKEATTWIQGEAKNKLLNVPEGYDLGSELSLALLRIAQVQDKNYKNALDVCTKESILTALKNMAVNGLSMSRNQCYPIVYGNTLQIQRSYFGTMATLERMFPQYKITTNVIYKGDEYSYDYNEETSCYEIHNLKSSLANKDNPIEGVFGFIKDRATGKSVYSENMTWGEVQKSWKKAKTHNVHDDFPQEMAKRTLINRMCKSFINKNKDVSPEFIQAYNAMTEAEYLENKPEEAPVNVEKEKAIREKSKGNAGLKSILKAEDATFTQTECIPEEPEEPVTPPPTDEDGNGVFDMGE